EGFDGLIMPRWPLPPAVLLAAVITGGRPQPVEPHKPQAPSCHIVLQSGPARDTVVVGVSDSLVANNDVWPFIFASLFEPLVRRDCAGQLGPGLAARWTSISSGLTFTI